MTRARPFKGTDEEKATYIQETLAKVAQGLKLGLTFDKSARAAGLNPVTFYRWKLLAEKEKKEPYASAFEVIHRSLAEGEKTLAGRIYNSSKKDWRAAAWLLERRDPDNWHLDSKKSQSSDDVVEVPKIEILPR